MVLHIEAFLLLERWKIMSVNKYNSQTGQLTCLANGSRIWVGTKAAYEAARQAGTMPTDVLVAITDDEQQAEAEQISYDNTDSGLTADNVQDAIDEVVDEIDDKQDKTDNNLTTTAKTIVGGINELNSALTPWNTISTGTIDPMSQFIRDGQVKWNKIGRLVFVNIDIIPKVSTKSQEDLFGGLPPRYNDNSNFFVVLTGENGSSARVAITTGGHVTAYYNPSLSAYQTYSGSCVYLAAE